MPLSIKQIVDLAYRQRRIVMIDRNLIPSRASRCVRHKANLIDRQIGDIAAQIFWSQGEPFDLFRLGCPGLGNQFDLSRFVCGNAPDVVRGRLAIL